MKKQRTTWYIRTTYNEHRPLPAYLQQVKDALVKRERLRDTDACKAR